MQLKSQFTDKKMTFSLSPYLIYFDKQGIKQDTNRHSETKKCQLFFFVILFILPTKMHNLFILFPLRLVSLPNKLNTCSFSVDFFLLGWCCCCNWNFISNPTSKKQNETLTKKKKTNFVRIWYTERSQSNEL